MHLAHDLTNLDQGSTDRLFRLNYGSQPTILAILRKTNNLTNENRALSRRNSLKSDETVDLKIYNSSC